MQYIAFESVCGFTGFILLQTMGLIAADLLHSLCSLKQHQHQQLNMSISQVFCPWFILLCQPSKYDALLTLRYQHPSPPIDPLQGHSPHVKCDTLPWGSVLISQPLGSSSCVSANLLRKTTRSRLCWQRSKFLASRRTFRIMCFTQLLLVNIRQAAWRTCTSLLLHL